MTDHPRRRSTDQIDPVIELFVQEQISEVRHLLRGEFTAALVGVTNKITELGDQLTTRDLRVAQDAARLEKRLGDLQAQDAMSTAVASALEKARTSNRNWMLGLAGLIVATASVLVAVLT